jgi:nitroreductase
MSDEMDESPGSEKSPLNEVFKNIYGRRSVRAYRQDAVPDDIIKELIRAGSFAPSAMNEQPWKFVVIKDKDLIKRLSDKAKELWIDQSRSSNNPDILRLANMMSNPDFNIFYNAPMLVMIFADPNAFSPQIDCALAAQNMMLAARSLGIDSCWIGLAMPLGKVRKILSKIGVPADHRIMASLIFGYPEKMEKGPDRRKDIILKWIS